MEATELHDTAFELPGAFVIVNVVTQFEDTCFV
jgi:hypothetical protein